MTDEELVEQCRSLAHHMQVYFASMEGEKVPAAVTINALADRLSALTRLPDDKELAGLVERLGRKEEVIVSVMHFHGERDQETTRRIPDVARKARDTILALHARLSAAEAVAQAARDAVIVGEGRNDDGN